MMNPTTRVLTLLELLQTHGLISGSELARRLAVGGRTVRRYIRTLEALGIPIATEPGRYGGYRLVAGFKLPPMMFTREETLALCLGLSAARRLGLAEAVPATASVTAKLERVLPEDLRKPLRSLSQSALLDLPETASTIDNDILLQLTRATQTQQTVAFRYTSASEVSHRKLNPYGVVFSDGRWYATGWCHLRKALRSFRLDRMARVECLPASFGKPENFDAVEYLQQSIASVSRALSVEVELKAGREQAQTALGKKIGRLEMAAGALYLRTQTNDLDWLASRLCGLPFDFVIHRPAALRRAVTQRAKHLMSLASALKTDRANPQ